MLSIVGFVVVTLAVLGGFTIAGGSVFALIHPSEFIIIGGAAIGMILISTPMSTFKKMIGQVTGIMKAGPSKRDYIELLVMMYEIFNLARRDGVIALESHIESPQESAILTKYTRFIKDPFAVAFFCDTVRSITTGAVSGHELDEIMELDLESHHQEDKTPTGILSKVGDSMPGFGIVAAVLGVVITMSHIDGPPEEIGHMVGTALVGTFLGILAAYGFINPTAMNIEQKIAENLGYYTCLKQGLLGFNRGYVPSFVAEFARRGISPEVRPSFTEVEDACREAKAGGKS
jgi:chemotaxis protein MotA